MWRIKVLYHNGKKLFAPAKTMATFLEDNKDYLLTHFGEMELSQGIAFLLKIERLRK